MPDSEDCLTGERFAALNEDIRTVVGERRRALPGPATPPKPDSQTF
jgi:hypothetical protein